MPPTYNDDATRCNMSQRGTEATLCFQLLGEAHQVLMYSCAPDGERTGNAQHAAASATARQRDKRNRANDKLPLDFSSRASDDTHSGGS